MVYILRIISTIIIWGWSPILITALAIVGAVFEWPIWALAPALGSVLVIGLVMAVIRAGERRLELSAMRLRQLTGHFSRRFTGTSSLSIFAIIDTLFNLDDPQLWDWARACDMSQRIFDTWCNSFIDRLESDNRTGKFTIYMRTFLNEMWLLNSHYYEFVEQFYEIAVKIDIPPATREQYARFAVEYNAFAHNLREIITELRNIAGTEIEPSSVKLANELSEVKPLQTSQAEEPKPSQRTDRRGHYL
ncbi:hypothetical protein ACFLU1_03780 [Chloroflexota bacterium]